MKPSVLRIALAILTTAFAVVVVAGTLRGVFAFAGVQVYSSFWFTCLLIWLAHEGCVLVGCALAWAMQK